MKRIHYGMIETDGETNFVVDIRAVCNNSNARFVSNDETHIDCKKCIQILKSHAC